jgi:hypothetical protein
VIDGRYEDVGELAFEVVREVEVREEVRDFRFNLVHPIMEPEPVMRGRLMGERRKKNEGGG